MLSFLMKMNDPTNLTKLVNIGRHAKMTRKLFSKLLMRIIFMAVK